MCLLRATCATAAGEQPVLRRKDERQQEQQRLGHDDNAAGRAVQIVAGPRAEEAGDAANGDRNHQQARKAVGQQPRGRAGGDHQTDHQKRADGLQRRHGRDRQQGKEEDFQAFRTQADGAGVVLIKKVTIRSFHLNSRITIDTTPIIAS